MARPGLHALPASVVLGGPGVPARPGAGLAPAVGSDAAYPAAGSLSRAMSAQGGIVDPAAASSSQRIA